MTLTFWALYVPAALGLFLLCGVLEALWRVGTRALRRARVRRELARGLGR